MSCRVSKFSVEMAVNRLFWNRCTLWLGRHGLETRLWRELETTGRRSGLTRTVPVAALVDIDGGGAWLISQHGRRSGWAHNIDADPLVRLRVKRTWRSGRAALRPDIDVVELARRFAPHRWLGGAMVLGFRVLQTDPIAVRIDFD